MKWNEHPNNSTYFHFENKNVILTGHRAQLDKIWYAQIKIKKGNRTIQLPMNFETKEACKEGLISFAKIILKWIKDNSIS